MHEGCDETHEMKSKILKVLPSYELQNKLISKTHSKVGKRRELLPTLIHNYMKIRTAYSTRVKIICNDFAIQFYDDICDL